MYSLGDSPTHEIVRPGHRRDRFLQLAGDVREVALTVAAVCWLLVGVTLVVGAVRILTKIW